MKRRFFTKLSLLVIFSLLFCSLPVKAATIPDISDVTAVWDSNIDTSWDHVYLEYKSLDPQSRYEADKVISANAYRFLISIGSKPLEGLNQQKFDDFLRAVSPFNIAYNNVIAEQVVHSAWVISGDQYKVFCANVIHNLASNSDYYNTHVIKNDPFVNSAGQQSLQVQYNDVDIDQSLNIYNNIFNGTVLTSTGGSVGSYYFNPLPSGYTGSDITMNGLNAYFQYRNLYNTPVVSPKMFKMNYSGYGYNTSYLYFSNTSFEYVPLSAALYFYDNNSNGTGSFSINYENNFPFQYGGNSYQYFYPIDMLSINYPLSSQSFLYKDTLNYTSLTVDRSVIQSSTLRNVVLDYFNRYFSDFASVDIVYTPFFRVHFTTMLASSGIVDDFYMDLLPSGSLYYVSPQFQPVNIYNNQYYGSDDDTYFYVDQMVDNIINNDYSTVNNGSNNIFYNDNYYITQPVSGGGIELVTSSSIVYNYITIINSGGGNTSGGSIGSYPYPFDVRIINPEDITNETIVNQQNQILNDYTFNLGDLNIKPILNTTVNNASESFKVVSNSAFTFISGSIAVLPSDLTFLIFSIIGVIAFIFAYKHVNHSGGG